MKRILCFAMAAALVVSAGCKREVIGEKTGSIYGFITDVSLNDAPIKTATILLNPSGKTTITGSSGLYEMDKLKFDRYMVSVFKENYITARRTIEVSAINTVLDIPMIASQGALSIDRAHIDFGTAADTKLAILTIHNKSNVASLTWSMQKDCLWVVSIDPMGGILPAKGSQGVIINIDRENLSASSEENQTIIVVNSSNGIAEILLTVPDENENSNTNDPGGIVVDNIVVQKTDIGSMPWAEGDITCKASRFGGHSNWRLPTLGELAMLYENRTAIGNFKTDRYWSSSVNNGGDHYFIHFNGGGSEWDYNSNQHNCRCVRTLP